MVGLGVAWLLLPPRGDWMERTIRQYCIECGTGRRRDEVWREGVRVHDVTEITPSKVLVDLLGDAHEHHWVLNSTSTTRPGQCSVACGLQARPNRFTEGYNENARFRGMVGERIASGAFPREIVARVVALRSFAGDEPEARLAEELCDGYFGPAIGRR